MHHYFYESHVWVFRSIEEFVQFLPVIVFSDIAINCENEDFIVEYSELDYTDRFVSLMNKFMPKWRMNRDELNKLPVAHNDWDYKIG